MEEKEEFVKTPTQKIRRFLYNRKKEEDSPASGMGTPQPGK